MKAPCQHFDPDATGVCVHCDAPVSAHLRHDVLLIDGQPAAMAPDDVRAHVRRMLDEGTILAVLVRQDDDVAVQVFGPPSLALVELLDRCVADLRAATARALRTH